MTAHEIPCYPMRMPDKDGCGPRAVLAGTQSTAPEIHAKGGHRAA
ncbi:hypothetical protein SXCC_04323 [Gluconacetobacter sp. SXCC-1]|nr:hypothetical protein SXCC_04323 [Gluconacetobacter sp. SXCC-1]